MEKPKKHRPKITVLLVPTVYPGESFRATVSLDAKAPVDIQWVEARLKGVEKAAVGSGKNRSTKTLTICDQRFRLCEAQRLPKGKTQLPPWELALPDNAPASYRSRNARVEYTLSVRVSISWWPDARASFDVNVGLAQPAALHPGQPVVVASAAEQPSDNEAHIEASLNGNVFVQGEVIAGSIALANVATNRYHGIQVRLVAKESLEISRWAKAENRPTDLRIGFPVKNPNEGEAFPFRFRLPDHLPPTQFAALRVLTYELRLRAERKWASDVVIRVPIAIVPKRFRNLNAGERNAPPTIGSDRVRAAWQRAADLHGYDLDGDEIGGERARARVTITREYRGRGGTYLVGELVYRDLSLDLTIQRAGGRGKKGRHGVQIGAGRWDKRHHVTCREKAQARALLEPLRDGLSRFRDVLMSDTTLRVEIRNAGTSAAKLDGFVQVVTALADTIETARSSIPAPAVMASHMDDWLAFANQLAGSLDHVGVVVSGHITGMPVTVRTEWTTTGEPMQTTLELEPTLAIDAAYQFEATRPIDANAIPGLNDSTRALLRACVDNAASIRVGHDRIVLGLPAVIETPAAILLPRLRALVRFASEMSPSAGPYR